MTLDELIKELLKLQSEGHGSLEVFTVNSASGCCDPLGYAFVEEITGNEDAGPYDMEVGAKYIRVSNGN